MIEKKIKIGTLECWQQCDLAADYRSMFFNRYILARIYVTVSIFISVLTALFEPTSIHHLSVLLSDGSMILMYLAISVCGFAIVDIIVNDFMSDKYKLNITYNQRHIIYMCLSLISFSLSLGILFTFGGVFLLGRLWLDGFVAAIVAILDIFARHKGTTWRYGKH